MSSSAETAPVEVEDSMVSEDVTGEEKEDGLQSEDNQENEVREQPKNIIRYSLSSLLSFRSSKSSQRMPVCINMDLSCMAHNKPPPKMPPASCMPKFALPNRGEESISPLSFNSNSSSSSNLSYQQQQHQKRYEGYQISGGGRDGRGIDGRGGDGRGGDGRGGDGRGGDGRGGDGRGGDGRGGDGPGGDGYNSGNRYYYNKYNKNYDDINGGGSSRIIYKTTSANSNGNNNNTSNNIRILKKAYNNKYEEQQQQPISTISNKNILGNSSQVMTAADYRNSTKQAIRNGGLSDEKKEEIKKKEELEKANKDEEANSNGEKGDEKKKVSEVNANDLVMGSDIKNAEEINLDEIFKMYSMNNLLPEKPTEERESSRFSKWFSSSNEDPKGDKPADKSDKNPGDVQNNNKGGSGASGDLFSKETEKYFEPIHKVENSSFFNFLNSTEGSTKNNDSVDNPLMTMINNSAAAAAAAQKSQNSGQVHSVEELEARLRKNNPATEERRGSENEQKALQDFFQQQMISQPQQQQQQQQQPPMIPFPEDVTAFKKLLSQITTDNDNNMQNVMHVQQQQQQQQQHQQQQQGNGQNLLQHMMNKNYKPQPSADLMQMQQPQHQQQQKFPVGLSKQQQQQQHQQQQQQLPNASGKMLPPHLMQQQNMDMMKFLQQKMPQNPQNDIMKRPETMALVNDLTSGELSQHNLWQRLSQPGIPPMERDIITASLNMYANMNTLQQPIPQMGGNIFPAPGNHPAVAVAAIHQIMQQQMKNTLTAPIPLPQTSPMSMSPVPPIGGPDYNQQLLFQNQAAAAAAASNKQMRLSPLPAGMPQRIPSPRELQYHTQSIMQNALIRKKLEEQRENFRKRQEQEMKQQQEHQKGHQGDDNKQENVENVVITSPTNVASNDMGFDLMKLVLESPTKQPMQHQISPAQQHQIQQQSSRHHTSSPSIFTPTSVLRKMTAEKDNDLSGKMGGKGLDDKKKLQQNRMPNQVQPMLGAGGQQMTENEKRILQQQQHFHQMLSQHQQPLPQQMQSMKQQQQQSMKQQGRPIVKGATVGGPQQQQQGGSMMQPQQQQQQQQQPTSQQMMPGNGGNPGFGTGTNYDYQQQLQKINMQKQFLQQQQQQMLQKQIRQQQQNDNPVLSQFMLQQQQRAQQQQQQHPNRPQMTTYQQMLSQKQESGGQQQKDNADNRNVLNNGGCLSPTSNQLAKWFSPQLLEDASAGKLPSMNVNQMLSLEEFEKCIQNT